MMLSTVHRHIEAFNAWQASPHHVEPKELKMNKSKMPFFKCAVGKQFVAKWTILRNDMLIMEARLENDKSFAVLALSPHSEKTGVNKSRVNLQKAFPTDSKFNTLSSKEANVLAERVLHTFIRREGATLLWGVVKSACSYLFCCYGTKYCQEALDVAMVAGDIAMKRGLEYTEIVWALSRVRLSLLALDRPLDSANIFQEAMNKYWQGDMQNYQAMPKLCAVALRHAGEYEQSKEILLQALAKTMEEQQDTWDMHEEETCDLLEHLIHTYYCWSAYVPAEESQGLAVEMVLILLSALLAAAGFQPGSESERISSMVSRKHIVILKDRYKKKRQHAKRALEYAIRNPQRFRTSILACREPRSKLYFVPATETPERVERHRQRVERQSHGKTLFIVAEGSQEEEKMDLLFFARESLRDFAGVRLETIACENRECDATEHRHKGNFMKCPCNRAYYCRKSCQVDNWKEHKLQCRYYARKQKRKQQVPFSS